ncbi:Na+/H+ antiporter subunit E [Desulfurispirillum indicum]|uniref:Cation antiporter n=1 Tax=Desulfurispirillum indicum (strain ATCC BAA-1389 / DSM 22839 / S5) TaxID=653733 RepID=E6W4F1_DESIS|nr:Na+/H+ antiporter subunit E [Desulfurispirillum indicum]ADU65925.1 cation antiporter [Desulfurispirillum indicum S5]UCZ57859.1 Na+/H+ antiporter subunit E [Desulfurispirillum indicum]
MKSSKWLPHPLMTVVLIVLWLLLNNTFSFGHVVLGAVFGVAIPLFTNKFWPERPCISSYRKFFHFFFVVFLYDVVVANITVVRLILQPDIGKLQPDFIEIPLEAADDLVISILASVISLTPGTVSSEVSADRKTLLVHNLNVPDKQEAIQAIKTRYEAPLKEIFSC